MTFASIIIPTYNQEEYVGEALESLLAQTDSDWEAVVVNDGSTDGTADILDNYAKRDGRFRIIHKQNGGVASALNAGLEAASGTWMHWLSSDDYFEPNKLEVNRQWIETNTEAEFFYSYFRLYRQNLGIVETRGLWGPRPIDGLETIGLVHRNFINGISICINRQAWLQNGTFDADLHYGQDFDMWLRLLTKLKACFIPEHLVVSRNHDAQGSESFPSACYFDSAKACLKLTRDNSFTQMVPYADLTNPAIAESAYQTAMVAASDPTSFLFRLGPAPDFPARIAEWLWSQSAIPAVQNLRVRFLRDAAELTLRHQKSDFGTMWGTIAASVTALGERFELTPSDPLTLAKLFHRRLGAAGKDGAALQTASYLDRFYDIRLLSPKSCVSARLLLLDDDAAMKKRDRAMAEELAQNGHLAVSVGDGYGLCELGFKVPRQILTQASDALPRLGRFDVLVAGPQHTNIINWVNADQLCGSQVGVSGIFQSISGATNTPKRKLVLLGLSPAGGGAEQVLSDMCAFIDRSRFDVTVAFLTLNELNTNFPAGARIIDLVSGTTTMEPLESQFGIDAAPPASVAVEPQTPVHEAEANERAASEPSVFSLALRGQVRRHAPFLRKPRRAAYRAYSVTRQVLARGRNFAGRVKRRAAYNVRRVRVQPQLKAGRLVEYKMSEQYGPSIANLKSLLATLGPDDVLVTSMEHAAVLSRMSVPAASFCTVVTLHTLESAYLPLVFTDASLLSEIKGVLKQMHNDSTFTFPSQGCAADFDEYLGASCRRSQVVPNPLNLAHINLRAMNEVPSEFELWCAGRKVISCVARLDPPKDQKTLIRALKRLSARVPQAAVVCIGSGVLEKELKSYAQELGVANKVLFVGYQANPMPFVKAARVSVLSSEFEAFGLVVVEAMAVGTPVIATDCPWGPGEIIGANNDYGILVPVGDEAAMAEALERILNDDDLYAHYSNVGLQRAQNYSYSVLRQAWSVVLDPDLALD